MASPEYPWMTLSYPSSGLANFVLFWFLVGLYETPSIHAPLSPDGCQVRPNIAFA